MFASFSRWVREGPFGHLLPWRLLPPLERYTVAHAYPEVGAPLVYTLDGEASRPSPPRAALLFGGDVALHRWQPGQDPEPIFGSLAALTRAADGLIVNLESQLSHEAAPAGTVGSLLRAPSGAIAVLSALGVRAVTCANNHALDCGSEGLSESLGTLRAAGIVVSGVAGEGALDPDPAPVLRVGGLSVALLSYTDDWRVDPRRPVTTTPVPHDPARIRADIAAWKARADLVVVQLHWGYEWSMYPLRSLRDLARSYADAGASLVVCHHAHVPMGLERRGAALVAQGMGNLYFGRPSDSHPFRAASFLLRVDLTPAGVTRGEVIPVETDLQGRVGPASARTAALVRNSIAYLSNRLDRDAYLNRVEQSLTAIHACELLAALAQAHSAGDAQAVSERIGCLELPRQRSLIRDLVAAGGFRAEVGALLELLRTEPQELKRPTLQARLTSLALRVRRYLDRPRSKGRIP